MATTSSPLVQPTFLGPTFPVPPPKPTSYQNLTLISLVSIGVLCDHNCTATFGKHAVTIHHHNQPILTGPRLPNGLWSLPLPHDRTKHHAYTLFTPKTQQQPVQWLQAAAFSPSPSTFLDAIQHNFFATWPGLTTNIVRRHLTQTDATVKGHLDQQRHRKRKHPSPEEQPIPSTGTRSHTIYAAILDPSAPTGRTYSDLTGRFPIQSNRGANYILVVYEYDSNAIIVRPLRNRTASEIKRVFQSVIHYLHARGPRPRLHTLDNEASSILHDYLCSEEVEYQLVPPHIHRQNASERAIHTFKNHFMAGLANTDPNFPLSNWCRLLPQAELTHNLLRASRLNPKLSAYAQLEGTFDFTRTPSHPQEPESSSTKNPPTANLGPRMAQMAGTLAQPSTIINAITSGYHAPTPNASSTPSLSSQKPSHFPNLPTKTPRSKPPGNLPTPYNNHAFADHSPNSMKTT